MDKRLNIIARYNEDISWAKDLHGDILVYNKGENYRWNYRKKDVPNIGRETETYARAVVENYYKLLNYDSVVFLQGHPFDHCPELISMLSKKLNNPFEALSHSFAMHVTPESDYIFGMHKMVVDLFWDRIDNYKREKEFTPKSKIELPFKNENGEIEDRGKECEELIYLCEIMGIDYKDSKFVWATGAQYLVSTRLLLNKSLGWWKDFLNLTHYTYGDLNSEGLGYFTERIWPQIWLHSDKKVV